MRIYFARDNDTLVSMLRSPFGGVISDGLLDEHDLEKLLNSVITWSQKNNIRSIVIRQFPDIYAADCSRLLRTGLLNAGFKIQYEDITQVISTNKSGISPDTHKKRRIRQAVDDEYRFELLPVFYLEEAYSLIVEARRDKGYPVTMSLTELKRTFLQFPGEYLLFGVFNNGRLIAASISIQVNNEILYTFYLGDSLKYRRHSPVTFLVAGIYDYCIEHQYKLLDLGTSTDKGIINHGLYNFKKTFGAIDSLKPTFVKHI